MLKEPQSHWNPSLVYICITAKSLKYIINNSEKSLEIWILKNSLISSLQKVNNVLI